VEFHHVERLAHEVVGAGVDAGKALVTIVLRRDNDDGNEARFRLILQPPADLEPMAARGDEIEHDEIGRRRRACREHLVGGGHDRHVMSLAQQEALEKSGADFVVVCDENGRRCGHSMK
jgi:hypothetical protein